MVATFGLSVFELKYLIKLMQVLCIRIMATAKHFTTNLLADLHARTAWSSFQLEQSNPNDFQE